MNYYGASDIGRKRKSNQDCFSVFRVGDYLAAVVCDGMGGAKGGNIASSMATVLFEKRMRDFFDKLKGKPASKYIDRFISYAVGETNYDIYRLSLRDFSLNGMGTTFTAYLTDGIDHITVNVGDSRIYYIPDISTCDDIKDAFVKKLTKDHSYVQNLIDAGTITEKEALTHPSRNVIMRAVGVDEFVEPDITHHELSGGCVLLCTDGLSGYFTRDRSYLKILKSDFSLKSKVLNLIDYANFNGGTDNITAVLVEI